MYPKAWLEYRIEDEQTVHVIKFYNEEKFVIVFKMVRVGA